MCQTEAIYIIDTLYIGTCLILQFCCGIEEDFREIIAIFLLSSFYVGEIIMTSIYFGHKFATVNPLLPIAHKSAQIGKILILKLEGIIKKISYERRDYESVDEKTLS